ncbi:hypothetical protein GQR36_04020 [Enterococcus termitis]
MKEIKLGTFSVQYDHLKTADCSLKIAEEIYIKEQKLPSYFIGEATMSFLIFMQLSVRNYSKMITAYQKISSASSNDFLIQISKIY